jgi:hypothetical protein
MLPWRRPPVGLARRARPRAFAALLALLIAAAGSPGDAAPAGPPVGAEAPVAARLEQGFFVVPVRLDTTGPERLFLFDTGMNITAIDSALAARLGLEAVAPPGTATDAAGQAGRLAMVRIPSIVLAGFAARDVQAAAVDLSSLRANSGLALEGILGANVLRSFPYTLDYQQGVVRFGAPDALPGRAIVLPLLDHPSPFLPPLVQLKVQGAELWGAIDAGALGGLYLPRRVLEDLRLDRSRRVESRGAVSGGLFGLGLPSLAARPRTVALGSLQLRDLPVESTESEFALIGAEFLRHFRVAVDYPRRRVVLEPVDVPWPHDVESFGLGLARDGGTRTVVTGVWADSPADRAGLRPGQRVLRVDGQPADSLSLPALRSRLLDPAGRVVALTVQGDSGVSTVTLEKAPRFAPRSGGR